MALPTYVTASTGASDTTGAWTATGAAPGAAGRIMILHVVQDGTTDGSVTFTSATNIENLAGTDNQWTAIGEYSVGGADEARQYLWIGRSLSTSAPTFTGGNSSGEDLFFRMYEFSEVSTGTTLATVIENVTAGTATSAGATSTTVADVGVTTLGTDRLALNFIGVNDDAQAAELTAMTGETGGDWTYPVAAYGDSAGTDATLALVTANMTAAGTINGGTDTITSGAWGVVGFALIGTTSTFTQAEAAFYDDGTETGSSVLDSGADSITRDVTSDSNIQLRVRLQETNAVSALSTDDYQLQYELNDSGTWKNVNTTGSPVIADSYVEANANANRVIAPGTREEEGQSFTGDGSSISSVKFYLNNNGGTATGNIRAKLYSLTGTHGTTAVPDSLLATSSSIDVTTVSSSSVLVEFTFPTPYQSVNGTKYFTAVEVESGFSGGLNVGWDTTSPSHDGNVAELAGGSWSAVNTRDLVFYVYTTAAAGTEVVGYNSASLTDGNATTNRLGSGSGSFVAGEISEDGLVDNLLITGSNYTELLYSLTLVSSALSNNDTLDFRVLRNGETTGMTYTVTPRITVSKGGGGPANYGTFFGHM